MKTFLLRYSPLLLAFIATVAEAQQHAPGYSPPRTSWGAPDVQGVWSNASVTDMQREPGFTQLVLTPEEAALMEGRDYYNNSTREELKPSDTSDASLPSGARVGVITGGKPTGMPAGEKGVGKLAVVILGPEMRSAVGNDELRSDPHATAHLSHAPFQNMADLEFARDSRHIDVLALVHKGTVAGNDRQRRDLAQVGNDVLGDAVAEVFLFGIAAHVGERKHADRDARRARRRSGRRRTGAHGRGRG